MGFCKLKGSNRLIDRRDKRRLKMYGGKRKRSYFFVGHGGYGNNTLSSKVIKSCKGPPGIVRYVA